MNLYNTIGINHAAEKFNTFIGHFTDYEMFKDQSKYSQFVICPAFMNYNHKTTKDLKLLVESDPGMKILYKEKRLFSYDIITPDGFRTDLFQNKNYYPFLFKYASGVLILQLAIFFKMDKIFTLGIDGGKEYNEDFILTKGNGNFLDEQLNLMNKIAEGKIKIIKL
ncbi:MAG: hypothetical protein EKK64_06150 [Neisseriaceae bacterium]|nr:MAG: hypothetical protein EKK64_06150 [Neisseriaceae bacterium]